MKKAFSKSLSWLLSVVMVFSMLVSASITINAQTNGHTREEAVAWARAQIGKSLDYDGAYGCQCVDLIAYYYQYLGNRTPGGNGCDYSHNSLPSGWTRIQNTPTFVPEPGDIVVWTNGGWKNGHVAIFLSGDTHSFTSIDQNWPQGSAVKEVSHNYNYVWGVIRPDFQTYHNPIGYLDVVSSSAPNKLYVKGWAFDYDNCGKQLDIHVYVGGPAGSGAPCYVITANTYRPDVEEVYPGIGAYHGYEATITVGNDRTGNQAIYVYAINVDGGEHNPLLEQAPMTANIQKDTSPPVISSIKVTEISKDGYRVTCTVTDNVGIKNVTFPTWTDKNGQDDIKWHDGTVSGNTATVYIKASEHNNELGAYMTHIYAYDTAGNSSSASIGNFVVVQDSYVDIGADFYGTIITGQSKLVSVDSSANVVQMDIKDSRNQLWHFVRNNDMSYTITNLENGKCLDVQGKGTASGTNVFSSANNGGDNQKWYFIKQDGNYYNMIPKHATSMALDVYGASFDHGAAINIWQYNNSQAQKFRPYKFSTYTISYNMNGGTGSIPNQLKVHGQYIVLSSTKPTRTGYEFLGWSTNASATTAQYQPGATYYGENKTHSLYAVWTPIKPSATTVSVVVGNTNTQTVFYWTKADNTKTYNLKICKDKLWDGPAFALRNGLTDLSCSVQLPAGYYEAYVDSCNDNGYTMSTNVVKFTVTESTPKSKSTYNGHTYEYYDQALTWNQAYKFCERKGGHLVTINSKEENDFIVEFSKSRSGNLWLGGRTFDYKTWYWITGETFDYQNWADGEPNNVNNIQDAIQLYSSGQWDDVHTDNTVTREFVCEYDNEIDASKYTPVYKENYNGHEYCFFEDAVDWQTAKKICEAKGGYLVIIDNADENSVVLSGMKQTSKQNMWIGVTDIAQEGVWKDVKGNPIKYSNWAGSQPDNWLSIEDYVHLLSDGTWNDCRGFVPMHDSFGFVCEFDDLCTGSGHKYIETVVAPTTSAQGYTLHTCSVCGDSYKDNYTDKLVEQLANNSVLSAETIKLGETIKATAKATGGTGEYLYQVVYKQTTQSKWTTVQNYKANATVTFKPISATTYDVCVKVKDSNNTEVKKFFTIKVTSDELKNVSTISAETINLGSTVTVNAKATGSTGFYTYAVYYKQKAQTKWTTKQDFKANNTIAVKPAKATTYDICVKVKDDKGTIVKKYFTVNVTNFVNTSTLSATEIKLGSTVKVSCSATGSTGYYQYAVYYKKTSDTKWITKQSYSSNNTVTIKPVKATTYDVCVKVKDNQDNVIKKYFSVTVK